MGLAQFWEFNPLKIGKFFCRTNGLTKWLGQPKPLKKMSLNGVPHF